MAVLSVKSVCVECGEKLPHEVKQILRAKQNITEIEDLGLILFSARTYLNKKPFLSFWGLCCI